MQSAPQSMPASEEVTVPLPVPTQATVKGVKEAVASYRAFAGRV